MLRWVNNYHDGDYLYLRPKIVFIAHSYHKKTQSYVFLYDYLKEVFDVELIFDEEWDTGKKISWTEFDDKYSAVVIFQMFPRENNLERIPNKNILYIPMYDEVKNWHFNQWYKCKDIKILSFSSTLYKKLKGYGLNVIYAQYFIEPKDFNPGNYDEVFFWQRINKINIKTVKKLFKNSNVKIHIHKGVDPGHEFMMPSIYDEKEFQITYSEWFDNKEEMQDFIKTKGIYVAPRFTEGIGMSFLEAIAQGKVIIANNQPTMSEYIQNGKTGFLCNFKCPNPINLKHMKEIQENTYNFAKAGYEKWLTDRVKIIHYINEEPKACKLKLWVKILLPFLSIERKKIIRVKFGSNASLTLLGIKIY